jgi:hypothetical protein
MKKANEILQDLLTKLDAEMFYSIQQTRYSITLQGDAKKSTIDKLSELGYKLKFNEEDFYFIYKCNIENGIELDITLTIK